MNKTVFKNMYDYLCNTSLNLHNCSSEEIYDFLNYLKCNKAQLGDKLYFKTLTNLLHVFYLNMDEKSKGLYVDLFLSINISLTDCLDAGDVFETLGIIIKGCNSAQKDNIQKYVLDNIHVCKTDISAMISACNCFRYMYPEVSEAGRKQIIKIIKEFKEIYPDDSISSSLDFTIQSLLEANL